MRFPLACSNTLAVLALLLGLTGCCSGPRRHATTRLWEDPAGLSAPVFDPDVDSVVAPPVGWKPEPLKSTSNHTDQVWLSPTGKTAYGAIHFRMPLPVGQSIAFSVFLAQMKKIQGEATLLDRRDDPSLPGIRFVAAGGLYLIRGNFIVAGFDGWTIYAGTLKSGPILRNELDLAIRAREHTTVGRPDHSGNSF